MPFELEKDVQWKIETPAGHSSPVVWGAVTPPW